MKKSFPLNEKRVPIFGTCLSPHGIRATRVIAILQDSIGEEKRYTKNRFGRSWWSRHRAAEQF